MLIRDDEWALVTRMFAFEFFQGASVALFFTSAVTLFLERFPVTELPVVFILSAFLLWFFGWLYSKLEHILTVKQITLAVLLFNTGSIFIFRILVFGNEPSWFYYLMMAWFNVVYLLNNLEFWGLASRLFNVRQSRRLFAIVSAGDIPAKFIGYAAAVVVIPLIGSHDLLWVAASSSLLSLLFFHGLISLDAFKKEMLAAHTSAGHHHNPQARDIYKLIAGNKLIQQVALISFFTLCCFLIVTFVFYGYIKHEFKSDKSLALFIAWFLAASRACTLVIKLFLTNRIADRLGVKKSLLITPVILGVICIVSLFPIENSTFYLFGIMAIATDVLRSAIQSPVLLATMQPLPLHQRLQGHTIMKGIMDPFAFFVVGLLLYLIARFYSVIEFPILSIVILVLLCLWITWIFSADKNYIQTLTAAIRNRLLNDREIIITDTESLEVLQRKISGSDEGEAVFILHLLANQPLENKSGLIISALSHPGALVRKEAVRMMAALPKTEAASHLHYVLKNDSNSQVKAEAIKILSAIDQDVDFSALLSDEDPEIAAAAISQILTGSNHHLRDEAVKKLQALCSSSSLSERKCASQVLSEVTDEEFHPLLMPLLHDPVAEVVQAATDAACRLKSPYIATLLFASFDGKNISSILQVTEACGERALPAVVDFIQSHKESPLINKLIIIMGRIGGADANSHLCNLIDEHPGYRETIFHALNQSKFRAKDEQLRQFETFARDYLTAAVQILFRIRFLKYHQKDLQVAEALQLELNTLRDKLLELFSLIYDPEKMQKAKLGLKLNTRESVPNALELIDLLTAKEFSQPFNYLFEHSSIEDKCKGLKQRYHEPYLSLAGIRNDILRDKSHDYHSWTKASVLYSIAQSAEPADTALLEPLRYSMDILLRETATFALDNQGIPYTPKTFN